MAIANSGNIEETFSDGRGKINVELQKKIGDKKYHPGETPVLFTPICMPPASTNWGRLPTHFGPQPLPDRIDKAH